MALVTKQRLLGGRLVIGTVPATFTPEVFYCRLNTIRMALLGFEQVRASPAEHQRNRRPLLLIHVIPVRCWAADPLLFLLCRRR